MLGVVILHVNLFSKAGELNFYAYDEFEGQASYYSPFLRHIIDRKDRSRFVAETSGRNRHNGKTNKERRETQNRGAGERAAAFG